MGTNAYTHIFVGVRVDDSAFWVKSPAEQETCPRGHVREAGQGGFCSQDGGRFVTRLIRRPTEGFERLVALMGWEPGGETWEGGWEDGYQRLLEDGYLFNANSVTSGEDDGVMALGKKVLDIGHYGGCGGPQSLDENEVWEAFSAVRERCEALGVSCKVKLFGQLYWSI